MKFKSNEDIVANCAETIRLNPNDVDAYCGRAFVYAVFGDKAIEDYNEALRIDGNLEMAYYNRGQMYTENEDWDRAIADYTQTLRLEPNYAYAYLHRGRAYYEKKDLEQAIASLNTGDFIYCDPPYLITTGTYNDGKRGFGDRAGSGRKRLVCGT